MNSKRYITCPWCGYENKNSGEFEENFGEIECGTCGEEFWYEREIEVSYSSGKIENEYFNFSDKEPIINSYISMRWEEGSECDCIYTGLDKTILPLPTSWRYVRNKE